MDIVKEQCDLCEIYRKFKCPPSKPVVGLPLADNLNQVVCMDLKGYIHNKVRILHLIDAAMPKPNSLIKIKSDNDSEWVEAKVLSF